ncbi:MAG TPA: hypothetical protein VFP33_06965 [Gallionella sp.]|nr:hypothetical protein [Gallionella sp.]
MSEHTKEPWRIGKLTHPRDYEAVQEVVGPTEVVVDTDQGPYVLASCNNNFPKDAKANARRIVACVNACAGLSTEFLEQSTKDDYAIRLMREADELRAQRDAAVAENAKITSDKYPFVHLRIDVSDYEKESAIREKLIELGWTPPRKKEPAEAIASVEQPTPVTGQQIAGRALRTTVDGCIVLEHDPSKMPEHRDWSLGGASPDADGWIEWRGGECPVAPECFVEVGFRNFARQITHAGYFDWANRNHRWDIIAYRVVQEGGAV